MRDAMNKLGSDSNKINPLVRVVSSLHIDGCVETSVKKLIELENHLLCQTKVLVFVT